ncbi:MAG: twin-arginine translocase TatA/TatE family subunit [Lachnospiraceae bacterium]|nr:twin-arginine translocase TatA/TatE family subunit [Lachnospiraceae bacterium]
MGLGMGEIVILLVIAYVVVGPEDMVKFARKLGAALRQLNKLRAEVSTELDLSESVKTAQSAANKAGKAADLTSDMQSVLDEIRKAEQKLQS